MLWTNLSRCEISRRLGDMGTPVSRLTVHKLLKKHGLGQRKARKKKSSGAHPDRNAQFENIAQLKAYYLAAGDPAISIDTKKKELIVDFAREGHTHTQMPVETLDHDFPSVGQGKLNPHGIYDLARNEGTMHLNTSHDTSEFCCDSIAQWWQQHGCRHYPNALRLLILCDGGGSNAANRHVFKEALQALAELLGLEIRIAHYPPYCSKHNPIVSPHYPCLPGRGLSFSRHCQAIYGKGKDVHGIESHRRYFAGVYETGKKCATVNHRFPYSIRFWKLIIFVNHGANDPLIGCSAPVATFIISPLLKVTHHTDPRNHSVIEIITGWHSNR